MLHGESGSAILSLSLIKFITVLMLHGESGGAILSISLITFITVLMLPGRVVVLFCLYL